MKSMKDVIVVNLFGGPGIGKSTAAARVFFELKSAGINCELVQEYAKRKTWEKNFVALEDQILVFAKQHHAMITAAREVDVIVTDSPLVLGIIYDKTGNNLLHHLIFQEYDKFNNLNFMLERTKAYNPAGRSQTEAEAIAKDSEVSFLLTSIKDRLSHLESVQDIGLMTTRTVSLLGHLKGFSMDGEPYPFPPAAE